MVLNRQLLRTDPISLKQIPLCIEGPQLCFLPYKTLGFVLKLKHRFTDISLPLHEDTRIYIMFLMMSKLMNRD